MSPNYYTQDVFTLPDVLSAKECSDYILFSEHRGYDEATVSTSKGAKMIKGIRNNYRLEYSDTDLANKLWQRVKEHIPPTIDNLPVIGLNEYFRFYRYDPQQRFNRHRDGRVRLAGRESRLTFLVYLNDDYEGGHTEFDHFSITPKAGTALCFVHELRHKGCPVILGTKYVLRTDIMYQF